MASRTSRPEPTPPPAPSPWVPADDMNGDAFVPDDGSGTRGRPVTRVPPAPPFYFKAHPNRWAVENGRIVPVLGKVKFAPGVGNCDVDPRTGKARVAGAKSEAEADGWTIIPFDAIPPHHAKPGQAKSYLRKVESRPDLTISIYDRVYPGSDRLECDFKGWYEFLDHLQAIGLVRPPASHVLRDMHAKLSNYRDSRAAKPAANTPTGAAEIKRIEVNMKVIADELARRGESLDGPPVDQKPASGESFNPEEE